MKSTAVLLLPIFLLGCSPSGLRNSEPIATVISFGNIETTAEGQCFARAANAGRFETICPPRYSEQFVKSLQRALATRGAYVGPINGQLDIGTRQSIQQFQFPRGIDSTLLAITTAQELGLIAIPSN